MTSPLKPPFLSMTLISNQSSGLPYTLEQNHMGLCKWNWRCVQSISVWSTTRINIIIHSFMYISIIHIQYACMQSSFIHSSVPPSTYIRFYVYTKNIITPSYLPCIKCIVMSSQYISHKCHHVVLHSLKPLRKKKKTPIFLLFICIYLINWRLNVL